MFSRQNWKLRKGNHRVLKKGETRKLVRLSRSREQKLVKELSPSL